ncbi:hypothetical protein V8E54_007398 [Elaphomyces granulatus]
MKIRGQLGQMDYSYNNPQLKAWLDRAIPPRSSAPEDTQNWCTFSLELSAIGMSGPGFGSGPQPRKDIGDAARCWQQITFGQWRRPWRQELTLDVWNIRGFDRCQLTTERNGFLWCNLEFRRLGATATVVTTATATAAMTVTTTATATAATAARTVAATAATTQPRQRGRPKGSKDKELRKRRQKATGGGDTTATGN